MPPIAHSLSLLWNGNKGLYLGIWLVPALWTVRNASSSKGNVCCLEGSLCCLWRHLRHSYWAIPSCRFWIRVRVRRVACPGRDTAHFHSSHVSKVSLNRRNMATVGMKLCVFTFSFFFFFHTYLLYIPFGVPSLHLFIVFLHVLVYNYIFIYSVHR